MNFTLDQLLALDAIARTGSFASAANELHKVPSAVSYSIQCLESALGVDVFDRSRRKAVLTDAGQKILSQSRSVITAAQNLERVASELKDGWEPELHVVVDGALPMDAVLDCIRRFSEPDIPTHLRLEVEYQEGVVDRFEDAGGDLALVLGFAGDGDDAGYDCTPLEPLELLLVAAADHPLSQQPVCDEDRASTLSSSFVTRHPDFISEPSNPSSEAETSCISPTSTPSASASSRAPATDGYPSISSRQISRPVG